jgi:FkbM family methyltransferase
MMKLGKLKGDRPGLALQRLAKVALVRGDRKVTEARMFLAKLRRGKGFVVRDVQGSKMYLDMSDKGLSSELYLRGIREAHATAEFQKRLEPGQVIVDIGANIGYYTLMEARAAGKEGQVYAIEPVDENIALLERNVEANQYKNVEIYNMAIGDKNCMQDINLSKQSNLGTFCKNLDLDPSGKTKAVEVKTLDSFLQGKRSPDIVRMDVEGYEFEILKGMKETIGKAEKLQMFIEVHADFLGKEKTAALYKIMKDYGVKECHVIKESLDVLKFYSRMFSKEVLPDQGKFDISIDEAIANERFHTGVYHLFAQK